MECNAMSKDMTYEQMYTSVTTHFSTRYLLKSRLMDQIRSKPCNSCNIYIVVTGAGFLSINRIIETHLTWTYKCNTFAAVAQLAILIEICNLRKPILYIGSRMSVVPNIQWMLGFPSRRAYTGKPLSWNIPLESWAHEHFATHPMVGFLQRSAICPDKPVVFCVNFRFNQIVGSLWLPGLKTHHAPTGPACSEGEWMTGVFLTPRAK